MSLNVGDYVFRMVPSENTPFDPLDFTSTEDLDTWEVSAEEGGFTKITVTVAPIETGLLVPGRLQWCHLAVVKLDGTLKLIAIGKQDPMPVGGDPYSTTLSFTCAPSDWEAQQLAILQPTKSQAHWHPALVDPSAIDDPVEILDGQSRVVEFHPATLQPHLNDLFGVGLTTWDVGDEWIFDSLQAEIADVPYDEVIVTVEANWTQQLWGTFDATADVNAAFGLDGQPNTLTGDHFESKWPEKGDGLGKNNGYDVRKSSLTRVYPIGVELESPAFKSNSENHNYITDGNLEVPLAKDIKLERRWYDPEIEIGWSAEQARRERISMRLRSGLQDIGLGNGGVKRIDITVQDVTVDYNTPKWQPDTYYSVGDEVQRGSLVWKRLIAGTSLSTWGLDRHYFDMGTIPPTMIRRWQTTGEDGSVLGGIWNSQLLTTERGRALLLAALCKGRAALANSMRCVDVTVEVGYQEVIEAGLWIGMKVRLTIPAGRLAIEGDTVEGKVVSYRIASSAAEDRAELTIRCSCGSGKVATGTSVLSYSQTGQAWDRIGIPNLSAITAQPMATGGIIDIQVENTVAEQITYVDERDYDPGAGRTDKEETNPERLIKDKPTNIIFNLNPLAAEDELAVEWEGTTPIVFEGLKQIDFGGTL